MPGEGLNLVMTDIPAEIESEFNRWYNVEHMRDELAYPGVLSARRYKVVKGEPTYLAMYELSEPGILEKPEYQYISGWSPLAHPTSIALSNQYFNTRKGVYWRAFTASIPEPEDVSNAHALLLRGVSVDPEHQEELEAWFDTEHIPALSQVPGVVRARRYRLNTEASHLKGDPPYNMAMYELERKEVLDSEEWHKAAETPWTNRIQHFFRPPWLRNIYERIYPPV